MKQSDLHLARRFLNTPKKISWVFGAATYLILFETWIIYSPGIWFLDLILGGLIYLVALFAYDTALSTMVRYRLWLWGRHKFNSMEEIWAFIRATDAETLERLAGMEHDEWTVQRIK